MTDLIGLCSICGRPGSMFTCILCGRFVCERCYNFQNSICIECKYMKISPYSVSFPID